MPVSGLCYPDVSEDVTGMSESGADRNPRFLGVDALWALCMSFNVYLALFRGWTAQRMRAQEWKYFVACYGCSFIPALAYLFVNTRKRGKVYGPALVRPLNLAILIALINM